MMTSAGPSVLPGPTAALNDPDISNMLGRKRPTSPFVLRLTEPLACEIFMVAAAAAGAAAAGEHEVFLLLD